MAGRGLRSVLQPVLYVGIALLLHGTLFLIPGGGPAPRDPGTTRGVRVKAYVEGPPASPRPASPVLSPREREIPSRLGTPTPVERDQHFSVSGSKTASGAASDIGADDGGTRGRGTGSTGDGNAGEGAGASRGGEPEQSAFGQYLSRLHSSGVQGWAKDSAQKTRRGWKEGSGAGASAQGWGRGARSTVPADEKDGAGKGTSGRGAGGDGARYMDPRVQMVVTSSPATSIEHRHGLVKYPDLKFKKHEYTSGWWNVYIELRTAKDGKVSWLRVLRPETDGPLERQFVAQVKKEIDRWSFDPKVAEIHVDVRFYVE